MASMTWDEIDKELNGVWKHWGDNMPMMAMEELAEFSQAISKYKREPTAERKENLMKEMADVVIALEALIRMWNLDIDSEEMRERIVTKLSKKY